MAKTLNQFLEGYLKVKNPDEQKFVDKHVVAKHSDRNGNDDEVFKGSKVKPIDRRKDRHGYNPGEDEKVYEELKGNQHKIDANKNGKLDAHDFKLLRKKKKVAEETEELDEISKATMGRYINRAKDQIDTASYRQGHRDSRGSGGDSVTKGIERKLSKRHGGIELAVKKLTREEAEQIDELSTDTMKSYGVKRSRTAFSGGQKPGESVDSSIKRKSRQINSLALSKTKINRARNTGSTVLNKEEAEQIDELSTSTLQSYRKKARAQGNAIVDKMKMGGGDWSKDQKDTKTLGKRAAGAQASGKQLVKRGESLKTEEAEQIDELSKATLGRYAQKAKNQMGRAEYRAGVRMGQRGGRGQDAMEKAHNKRADKRHRGLTMAIDKLAKEEVEIEEKLNMDKASMGDVIKDFQDSNAPQFKGKSKEKRRAMAIAAKLTAERGGKPLRKEEKLADLLDDLSESHRRTMLSVFDKLNESNQKKFLEACETPEGVESMLDFSISHRGE